LKKTGDMMKTLGDAPLLSEDLFSRITKPVLVLLGDLDDMADPEYSKEVARLLPSGKFQSLVHTHHPIERTDAGKLGEIIDGFLRSL
jgi:pimeloyl-ACP methyl ester carboxylesterase